MVTFNPICLIHLLFFSHLLPPTINARDIKLMALGLYTIYTFISTKTLKPSD